MEKIDLTLAKQMVDRYQTTRKELIDQKYGIKDTESVWFDVAAFKDYAANLPAETTGVRIYLGVYDDADPMAPGQTTVIVVGTIKDGASNVDSVAVGSSTNSALDPVNKAQPCPPYCV